jgi:hypothetical protein
MGTQVLGDTAPMFSTAKAIMQLQLLYGLIPRITGKGHAAQVCAHACGAGRHFGCQAR